MNPGFLFGNYPLLSQLELATVLTRLKLPSTVTSPLKSIGLVDVSVDPVSVLPLLGGSVKAGLIWVGLPDQVEPQLVDYLSHTQAPQICYSGHPTFISLPELAKKIKSQKNGRFRFNRKTTQTAGIGPSWQDFTLLDYGPNQILLLITQAVQDIEWWSKKDFSKPAANARTGLMPPKMARILVNLALPYEKLAASHLLDPFCGSGTIGLEALDLGFGQVTLTDLNQGQTQLAKKNVDWFNLQKPNSSQVQILTQDVMAYPKTTQKPAFDAIVFEGHLGPPSPRPETINDLIKGLTKFYIGVFKRLYCQLRPQGRLVAALPAYQTPSGLLTLKSLIDTCEKLGYTFLVAPQVIGRPHAQVKREIYILTKIE